MKACRVAGLYLAGHRPRHRPASKYLGSTIKSKPGMSANTTRICSRQHLFPPPPRSVPFTTSANGVSALQSVRRTRPAVDDFWRFLPDREPAAPSRFIRFGWPSHWTFASVSPSGDAPSKKTCNTGNRPSKTDAPVAPLRGRRMVSSSAVALSCRLRGRRNKRVTSTSLQRSPPSAGHVTSETNDRFSIGATPIRRP